MTLQFLLEILVTGAVQTLPKTNKETAIVSKWVPQQYIPVLYSLGGYCVKKLCRQIKNCICALFLLCPKESEFEQEEQSLVRLKK